VPGPAGPSSSDVGRPVSDPRSIDAAATPPDAIDVSAPSSVEVRFAASMLTPTDMPTPADIPTPDVAPIAVPERPAVRPAGGGPVPAPHERQGGCTTAQLRRFIKSRAYVPMHEIRRRFLIATEDDDVAGIELASGRIFVGLPEREGQMLGDLLRGGEVGYELQLDPIAPVVIGVYPMRPVSRN
jgi:hypothetical protein